MSASDDVLTPAQRPADGSAAPDWPRSFTFDVIGALPAPQGSKKAQPIYRGRREARVFTGKVHLQESAGAKLETWRNAVAFYARRARGPLRPLGGPVYVDAVFRLQRPLTHFGTGRNAHIVKPTLRGASPTAVPDVDKLLRALLDALTSAQLYVDDAQVVMVVARKVYANLRLDSPGPRNSPHRPGAAVVVSQLRRPG